ncbi:MAG: hypothetical protein K2L42_01090 [Clostridia bacterium]|nr:hypothetical protein [Clostridia bacterium]
MTEILKEITAAEEKAAQIKSEALARAAKIAEDAEAAAAAIAKRSEAECKTYRESSLRKAESDGEKLYLAETDKKRAEAKAYADKVISESGGAVNEIAGRITRGSC